MKNRLYLHAVGHVAPIAVVTILSREEGETRRSAIRTMGRSPPMYLFQEGDTVVFSWKNVVDFREMQPLYPPQLRRDL